MVSSVSIILCILRILLILLAVVLLITFVPGILPHIENIEVELDETMPLTGHLGINQRLNKAERWKEGELIGPESIAAKSNEEMFVSVHGGKIIRIYGKNLDETSEVTRIGLPCDNFWEEEICGRPLGLRLRQDGKLLVADPYYGIFEVDVETGDKKCIVNASIPIDGIKPLLIDDLDIDSDGFMYWSDASSVSTLQDAGIEMLSGMSGRFFRYDPKTGKSTVLLSKIHFSNGVQLSPDERFVLLSETFRHRVIRYWLRGPKTGTSDYFIKGLPGMPDNIRQSPSGGYYVSLVSINGKDTFKIGRFLGKHYLIRKFITRSLYLTRLLFKGISYVVPNQWTSGMAYKILNLKTIEDLLGERRCIVVELDAEGNIIDSLQSDNDHISRISETQQVGDYIYFASPFNKYLGRLYVGSGKIEPSASTIEREAHDDDIQDRDEL